MDPRVRLPLESAGGSKGRSCLGAGRKTALALPGGASGAPGDHTLKTDELHGKKIKVLDRKRGFADTLGSKISAWESLTAVGSFYGFKGSRSYRRPRGMSASPVPVASHQCWGATSKEMLSEGLLGLAPHPYPHPRAFPSANRTDK